MTTPHTHGGTDAPECTTCGSQRPQPEHLTVDEVAAVKTALYAYQLETKMYLDGYNRDAPHDPCCATYKAFLARRVEERASLEFRLTTINAALTRLGADE